jgi:putative FmdB family regulatory protein
MPLYEYLCRRCGARFTLLQPMSVAREGHTCPECGSVQTSRTISTFACCGSAGEMDAGGCGPAGSPFR